ncbi:MAG: response regulator [Burkholderiaceae bacterium]
MPAQKILVVDDNPDFRAMMRYQLEMWGYEVTEAEEGLSGLRTALEQSPDLILLDYHMPAMNGIEVAKAVLTERPDLSVLFITADFELGFLREMDPRRTHVVQKPFDLDDLQRNIRHLMKPAVRAIP